MSKGICGSDSKKLFKTRKENCNMVASEKKRTVSFPGWQPHTRIRYGAKIWPCARMVAPCGMISLTETTFSRFRLNVCCCLQSAAFSRFRLTFAAASHRFLGLHPFPKAQRGLKRPGHGVDRVGVARDLCLCMYIETAR